LFARHPQIASFIALSPSRFINLYYANEHSSGKTYYCNKRVKKEKCPVPQVCYSLHWIFLPTPD
ncbi:MAG TPA: hypothetical protein VN207_05215, partial [Ktedonobacteraceae bacterium]|nr:hypothetical protein [Ktedonobacteraceae bacterium]